MFESIQGGDLLLYIFRTQLDTSRVLTVCIYNTMISSSYVKGENSFKIP